MRQKIETRIEKLEKTYRRPNGIEMQCDNGETFWVNDPLDYIVKYGNTAPNGRRIVCVTKEGGKMDELSASLYDYANDVLAGKARVYTTIIDENAEIDAAAVGGIWPNEIEDLSEIEAEIYGNEKQEV